MKYATVPVVAAPYGMTLGGGLELCLGARQRAGGGRDVRRASSRWASGLVPGGGGTMNLLWRALEGVPEGATVDTYALVTQVFKNVALARVATSAEEAKALRLLPPRRTACRFDRARLLTEAKARAIGLAESGWHPPAPRAYVLPGRERHRHAADDGRHARRRPARRARTTRRSRRSSPRSSAAASAARSHEVTEERDARARARGLRQPLRRAEEPGAHAVHAHEQQAAEELSHDDDERRDRRMRCVRPSGRAHKGTLALTRPDELAGQVIAALMARVPQVKPADVEDLVLGCAMPEGEQGLNVARVGGLPRRAAAVETSARDDQPVLLERPAGDRASPRAPSPPGADDVVVAGGVESMTMVPMTGNKLSASPEAMRRVPRRLHADGHHGRERREAVRHLARRSGRVRAPEPAEGGGARRRRASSTTRSCP